MTEELIIDFDAMQIGDQVTLPTGKFGEAQRKYYKQACEYGNAHPGVGFDVYGNEGTNFKQGQYCLRRVR